MNKFKQFKQLLVMLLCITMSISMLYQPVYAIDTNDDTQNVVNTTAENIEKSGVRRKSDTQIVTPYAYRNNMQVKELRNDSVGCITSYTFPAIKEYDKIFILP